MKEPGADWVIWAAMRLAALPAPKGVAEFPSSSKLCSTMTFKRRAGSASATPLANLMLCPIPNTLEAGARTSVVTEKLMKFSPPTTCRPGVVSAVLPAKGSVSKLNTVAFAVELSRAQVAAAQMAEDIIRYVDFIGLFSVRFYTTPALHTCL